MDLYEKVVTVGEDDLDDLLHVNNVRYVEWIQEISKEHWEERASEKIKNEAVWVVLSHQIQYRNEARLGDNVIIKTYITDTKGAVSVRAVKMYLAEKDILLVESSTEWCLLNASTLRPMRISQEIRSFFESNSKKTP